MAQGQSRGQVVPYADQRAYTDRLNAMFSPASWTRRYAVHASANFERTKDQRSVAKVLVTCELTILGSARTRRPERNGLTTTTLLPLQKRSGVNLRVERHRLLKVQADLSELELFERRRKLIPIEVYERLLLGWVITIRQRVLALPSRLSSVLVGLDRRSIQDVINRECRDMLLILSQDRGADLSVTGTAVTETETQSARRGTP